MALDKAWLESLAFDAISGVRITGLAGVGSENVVLAGVTEAGEEVVLRTPRSHLGFHINEIPPGLSKCPQYDVARLNEKLATMVGVERFDTFSLWLNRLYAKMIKIISEHGVHGLILSNMLPDSVESIPFILETAPMRRRLEEIATWPIDPKDFASRYVTTNGEEYPVRFIAQEGGVSWAKEALGRLTDPFGLGQAASASTLLNNPLIIWGAAAMEGFFSDDEIAEAANFINARFGPLVGREDTTTLIAQAQTIANLCVQYRADCPVQRMVKLCAACGFLFQVQNLDGDIVADGFA
jgi:hypothetical protein